MNATTPTSATNATHASTAMTAAALPATVAWLGYGGLLPFVFLATAIFIDPDHAPLWGDALTAYGAIILSFVGALHWGSP